MNGKIKSSLIRQRWDCRELRNNGKGPVQDNAGQGKIVSFIKIVPIKPKHTMAAMRPDVKEEMTGRKTETIGILGITEKKTAGPDGPVFLFKGDGTAGKRDVYDDLLKKGMIL